MSTQTDERSYGFSEAALLAGVTTRTIRYDEELGLVGTAASRSKGAHHLDRGADVGRLRELIRLRELLGLSLEELVGLAEADEQRTARRDEWECASDRERLPIVDAATQHVERQLELLRGRQQKLSEFAGELAETPRSLHQRELELTPR